METEPVFCKNMKTFKFSSLIIMALSLCFSVFSSCSDDKKEAEPDSFLSVSTSSLTLDAGGGSVSFSVSSNVGWTVAGNAGWLTVSPSSGSGNKGVVLTAVENNDVTARSCTLTIRTDDGVCVETVRVEQSSAGAVLAVNGASEAKLNFGGGEGESQQLNITANADWVISDVPDWIQVSPMNGKGNSVISIKTTKENFSDEDRLAVLHVSGNGTSAKIDVNQVGVLAKNLRVDFKDATIMCDGFAATLEFPTGAKGYKEKIYLESELASKTDRDIYNELMTTDEYEGKLDMAFSGKYDKGAKLVYCVAAYGNENNADGTHKYGPCMIKHIQTKTKETLGSDMYLTLTSYKSDRWTVDAERKGKYGQDCDDYFIIWTDGDFALDLALYNVVLSEAAIAHAFIKPALENNYDSFHKYGPQTIICQRTADMFYFSAWGQNRNTKEFSNELSPFLYKDLSEANSAKKVSVQKSQKEMAKLRHSLTHERIAEIRKHMRIIKK